MEIIHGSLFSGIGGFDLAAERAGMVNKFNCEIKERCRKILKVKFPKAIQYSDVREVKNPPRVDVLSGGFPCQDISLAKTWTTQNNFKKNGIKGKRSGLWFEYARVIREAQPLFVVAENVQTLTKQGLDQVLHSLAAIGYYAEWQTIPASAFGAPHLRNRIFIVAYPQRFGREQESIVFGKEFNEAICNSQGWEFSRTIRGIHGKAALPEYYGIPDGLPTELDRAARIEEMGNAVVPQIPQLIFETIKPIILNIKSNAKT
jgi:DNA (cytosine-5)-methyltransferase 1